MRCLRSGGHCGSSANRRNSSISLAVALILRAQVVEMRITKPSVFAVAAKDANHVAAAIKFARENDLRLVVKGGGHSYQGTSHAADSLLVWTRHMHDVSMQEAFVPQGCAGKQPAQRAVTCGSGAIWMQAYDAVTTKAGAYVQGGGCTTVGVAGLVQSGGFGSFSKQWDIRRRVTRSGSCDCRWKNSDRERVHEPGPVLGAQRRRRKDFRRRDQGDAARKRPSRIRGRRDFPGQSFFG